MSGAENGFEGTRGLPYGPSFRPEFFDEFVSVLGAARAAEWVERLDQQLASAFADDNEDPNVLRDAAHTIVSLAGMIGFVELAQRCSALEEAILAREPHSAARASVRREAQRVAGILVRLKSDLSGMG